MNIFALYPSPIESARAHCDQHIHKMILESAQIVSTAFHNRKYSSSWLYKPAYQKHPCTIWTSANNHNISWLLNLATELASIRKELNRPTHSSSDVINYCMEYISKEFPYATWAVADTPVFAGPAHIKYLTSLSIYEKYQMYYRYKTKMWALDSRLMTWYNRPVPLFMDIPAVI